MPDPTTQEVGYDPRHRLLTLLKPCPKPMVNVPEEAIVQLQEVIPEGEADKPHFILLMFRGEYEAMGSPDFLSMEIEPHPGGDL